jgi:hypothetical protein
MECHLRGRSRSSGAHGGGTIGTACPGAPMLPSGRRTRLTCVMLDLLKDDTEVYKQFAQNESFRWFITDMVYQIASEGTGA